MGPSMPSCGAGGVDLMSPVCRRVHALTSTMLVPVYHIAATSWMGWVEHVLPQVPLLRVFHHAVDSAGEVCPALIRWLERSLSCL